MIDALAAVLHHAGLDQGHLANLSWAELCRTSPSLAQRHRAQALAAFGFFVGQLRQPDRALVGDMLESLYTFGDGPTDASARAALTGLADTLEDLSLKERS